MQRLYSASQFLMFCRGSAPSRWSWAPVLARRSDPIMAGRCRSPRHVPRVRIRQRSRYTAGSRGIQCEELSAPDTRSLVPSAIHPIRASIDTSISLAGKQFPIIKGTNDEENAIQKLFARYDGVRPAAKDDGRKSMDACYGDEDANMPTAVEFSSCKRDTKVEVTYGQEDVRGVTEEDVNVLCSDSRPYDGEEDERGQSATEVSDVDKEYSSQPAEGDDVRHLCPLPLSSHRDGSIYTPPVYKGAGHWKEAFHIADRNETRFEAMMSLDPDRMRILSMPGETWVNHGSCSMWQVFSIKLSKLHVDCGPVELYGYIAARDRLDPLLNYIVNISRDDPVTVEQGSLIEMTGPKRGIDSLHTVLIEYDMRIKKGDREEDDLQLIDGAGVIDELSCMSSKPFTKRIDGNSGVVDVSQILLGNAAEATMEVFISEVQHSFNLCISCFTSGLHEEIRLFDGMIGESRGLRRQHVIAVKMDTCLDLKFKTDSSSSSCSAEHCCSFNAVREGCSSQEISMELASISVKVAWSTLNYYLLHPSKNVDIYCYVPGQVYV